MKIRLALLSAFVTLTMTQCLTSGPLKDNNDSITVVASDTTPCWGCKGVYIPVTIMVTSKVLNPDTNNEDAMPLVGAEVEIYFTIERMVDTLVTTTSTSSGTGASSSTTTTSCATDRDNSTDTYPTFYLYQDADKTNTCDGMEADECTKTVCRCDIAKSLPNIVNGQRLTRRTDSRGTINLEIKMPENRKTGKYLFGKIYIEAQSGNIRAASTTITGASLCVAN